MIFKKTTENPVEYEYGPQSVAVVDLNDDSWLNMVIANVVDQINVYLGDKTSVFSSPFKSFIGLGSAPFMVVVGDLNNDERLDITLANFDTNNIVIFHGYGNGTFANFIELSTERSRPKAIYLVDLNNNRVLDITTVNYETDSIGVFYGYSNGSCSNLMTFSTGYDSSPSSLAIGDFDGDNYFDLVVANSGTDNIVVYFGNINKTFSNGMIFPTGRASHPSSIICRDLNDDHFLDIYSCRLFWNEQDQHTEERWK